MGFLTSGLTEAQQAENQQNFQIGLNIGVQQAQQQVHAQAALAQMQAQQQAEAQRQQDNIALQNDAKKYMADQRLQGIQDKSAADFASKRASDSTRYISTIAGRAMSGLDQYIKHPDVYSPKTIKQANDQANQILGITADFDQAVAGMKPGDDINYTPFSSKLAQLQSVEPEFSDEYKAKIASGIGLNDAKIAGTGAYAKGRGDNGINPSTGLPQVFSDWQSDASGYHAANQSFGKRKIEIDAADKYSALANMEDPLKFERGTVEKSNRDAEQSGIAAMTAAEQDDGEVGRMYRYLRKKGIQSFTPSTIDQVGSELGKIYSQQQDDRGRNAVARQSLIFTARPIDDFIPKTTSQPWVPGGWGGAMVPPDSPQGQKYQQSQIGMTAQ